MEWPARLRVALGVARGLAYLHSGSEVGVPIAHMDLKSTNILLGEDFEAKVSQSQRLEDGGGWRRKLRLMGAHWR